MKKILVSVPITFLLLGLVVTRVEAQCQSPEPYRACAAKLQCNASEGWVVTATEPEGTPCSTTYNGPINGICTVSPRLGPYRPATSCVPVPPKYSVGGTVSGLAAGSTVILENDGGSQLFITQDGRFTFGTGFLNLAGYDVTVKG